MTCNNNNCLCFTVDQKRHLKFPLLQNMTFMFFPSRWFNISFCTAALLVQEHLFSSSLVHIKWVFIYEVFFDIHYVLSTLFFTPTAGLFRGHVSRIKWLTAACWSSMMWFAHLLNWTFCFCSMQYQQHTLQAFHTAGSRHYGSSYILPLYCIN